MSVNGLGGTYRNVSSNAGRTAVPGAASSAGAVTGAGGVIVEISDGARAASAQAAAAPPFKDVGMAARTRLDALKQQAAEKTGTTAGAVNLNHVDYSSFSDQDLAAMHLNSSGNFSRDEQNQAQGVLGERMRVSLEACRGFTDLGDRRGHAMTIDAQ